MSQGPKTPQTPLRTLHQRFSIQSLFGGSEVKHRNQQRGGDVEDQVIQISPYVGESNRTLYRTKFLLPSEEIGGEDEVKFFKKLDEELNKVNAFYRDKVDGVVNEAAELKRQMDAYIALRIKLQNPGIKGSDSEIAMEPLKARSQDFFLADQLTSQVQAIRSIEFYICYYSQRGFPQGESKCHNYGVYNAFYFVIAVIPYWLRFFQCLRRLVQERDFIHGYNALKYLMAILAVIIRTVYELKNGTSWLVMALISSAMAVGYNTYWDIVMDWGLLRRNSKNPFLRDRLLVSHKSVYYIAMVINVILRATWVQLVLEFNVHGLRKQAFSTTISCLEIIRRGIWNFFRLENEYLNNVGKFRAFKSVPLPFNYYDHDQDQDDTDEDDDEKDD